MMTLEQIQHRLHDMNHSEVARQIGITRAYVSAIARGAKINPSYNMMLKLSEYLESIPQRG